MRQYLYSCKQTPAMQNLHVAIATTLEERHIFLCHHRVFINTELMYSSNGWNQRLLVSNSTFSCWHRQLNGSAGPSLQAAVQLHMPASVLCSATDLFGLLGRLGAPHSVSYSLSWLSHGAVTFPTNSKHSK